MNSQHTIYFRADGNGAVGFGHVVRSLALADMLKNEYKVIFISKMSTKVLESEVLRVCSDILWIDDDLPLHKEYEFLENIITRKSILVIDGYNFTTDYQRSMKKIFSFLVAIDDLHAFTFLADVIINQSGRVRKENYQSEKYFQLCSGYDYLLLRQPFLDATRTINTLREKNTVFICFGGADVNNITLKAVEAALLSDRIKRIFVVITQTYKFKESLQFLKNRSSKTIEIHEQLNAEQMCELMKRCSFAIAPSSSISLELCSVGIGLISGYCVDNQVDLYEDGLSKGVFLGVGDLVKISTEELAYQLSSEFASEVVLQQKKFFKGQSAENFKHLFHSLSQALT